MKIFLIFYLAVGLMYSTAYMINTYRQLILEGDKLTLQDYLSGVFVYAVLTVFWPLAWLVFSIK